ncbi:DNA-directed RNA polymerase subunit omega [Isoptericola aurantiacus]|uniref:DNA-directed RNA polymerase subunit omega n=1 Tax=Isoptericola aurantiacus TaxID=3377839 RepID=UPI00383A9A51
MAGTVPQPIGITDPPIDDLLQHSESKYGLVLYAAKRARQINAYYSQLNEGLLENVGPLVETRNQEKPLSIAMREINEGLLTAEPAAEPVDVPLRVSADEAAGEEPSASEHVVGDEIV